jgi:hypothetical protein
VDKEQEHTQAGHPGGTKPKPGVDIRAAKGEGHVMCEIIKTKTGPYEERGKENNSYMFISRSSHFPLRVKFACELNQHFSYNINFVKI